jgi:hypothetical protein
MSSIRFQAELLIYVVLRYKEKSAAGVQDSMNGARQFTT